MIKGSEARTADHPIDRIFLDRWSPRSMSGEPMERTELLTLFEAARWAPSSNNHQPWRILYALRDTDHWPIFYNLLVDGNKAWARNAAALLVFISKTSFDHNGATAITHSFDTGAAWQNFALQGTLKGYVVHGMQGFNYERAKSDLAVPNGFRVEAMAAVGKPAAKNPLLAALQSRESPNGRRKLSDTVCEGRFSL